jgi:hypothetical protein
VNGAPNPPGAPYNPGSAFTRFVAGCTSGLIAYDIGAGRDAAEILLNTADLARRMGDAREAWRLTRKAGNALMWAADWSRAQSLLFDVAAQHGELVEPGSAFCAMTDLFFMALESESHANLLALLADCREMIRRHGNESWECRPGLLEAMLACRRGERARAGALARSAYNVSANCNVNIYTRYAHAKWIALAAFPGSDGAAVIDGLLAEFTRPSSTATDSLRWWLLETLRARLPHTQPHLARIGLEAARAGLRMIARVHGVWDERYAYLRLLLLAGELDEFEHWLGHVPLPHNFEKSLITGDGFLARWLEPHGEPIPDWDLAPDQPPTPWEGAPPPPAESVNWNAALANYVTALDLARREDARLETTVHEAAVARRLLFMRERQAERRP